jgi:hypothetical protein
MDFLRTNYETSLFLFCPCVVVDCGSIVAATYGPGLRTDHRNLKFKCAHFSCDVTGGAMSTDAVVQTFWSWTIPSTDQTNSFRVCTGIGSALAAF